MPFSNTFFLEVNTHVSLKVATKYYYRRKKNSEILVLLLPSSKAKKIEVSLVSLVLLYFVQQHIF